ncbi:ECF transporter S component [Anaerorhabdus sp.]|uniref:ECF transporter S component n=1 Tax=Anaerorhabdus sp. TaxID=1872524 RepID=UPI002FC5CC65
MNKTTKKIAIAAVLLAIGLVLPKVFHLFGPEVSKLLSPLHLPAFFAGFLLGGPYGLLVGVILPLLSSILTAMPPLVPMGVSMAFEIGTYGLMSGLLSKKMNVYFALILAIVSGRVMFSIVQSLLLGFTSMNQWWTLLTSNFVSGAVAIVFQLVLIPILVTRLKKVL